MLAVWLLDVRQHSDAVSATAECLPDSVEEDVDVCSDCSMGAIIQGYRKVVAPLLRRECHPVLCFPDNAVSWLVFIWELMPFVVDPWNGFCWPELRIVADPSWCPVLALVELVLCNECVHCFINLIFSETCLLASVGGSACSLSTASRWEAWYCVLDLHSTSRALGRSSLTASMRPRNAENLGSSSSIILP